MDAAKSITSPPLLHAAVANEVWSFYLSSHLLASFLDNASDLCNLSTSSRVLVPFRAQILRVQLELAKSRSVLTKAIKRGRLLSLSELE